MNETKLTAESRTEKDGLAKKVLLNGYIPAVIYGRGVKNINLKIKKIDFERAFAIAGESNLIDLAINGNPAVKVIVRDFQKNAVKGGITHIDFYQVDMKKKVVIKIPLDFIGISKAVKELGGILVKNMDEIEVQCLPGDLVGKIEVDMSKLDALNDIIRISGLSLPKNISAVNDQSEVVASIVEPRKIEEKPQEAEEKAGEEAGGKSEEGDKGEEKKDEGDKKEEKDKKN